MCVFITSMVMRHFCVAELDALDVDSEWNALKLNPRLGQLQWYYYYIGAEHRLDTAHGSY